MAIAGKTTEGTARRRVNAADTAAKRRASSQSSIYSVRQSGKDTDGVSLSGIAGNYLAALLSVVTATVIFTLCRRWMDANDASLFYLPVVIACAVRLGFGAALFAAAACFLSWDYYFVPPFHTFEIDSQSSLVSMVVFAITAVTTSRLAARARERAIAAAKGEADMAALLRASELVSREVGADETLANLVREACRSCESPMASIFERDPNSGELNLICSYCDERIVAVALDSIIRHARQAFDSSDLLLVEMEEDRWAHGLYAPIQYQGNAIGMMHVGSNPSGEPFSGMDRRLIATLASHAAVVIARKHAMEESQARVRQSAVLDERQRMAREVHDTLSNTFSSIKFMLEAAQRTKTPASGRECVDMALRLAVEGAQEARRSVWALRPVAFDDQGSLVAAIHRLAESRPKGDATSEIVRITGEPRTLNADIEDNILRIAQEAVSNAHRHSKASTVEISLSYTPECVYLRVQDDGVGFDAERSTGDGFGLGNMRSRAEQIGAEFTISSRPGAGTIVEVAAPAGRNAEEKDTR